MTVIGNFIHGVVDSTKNMYHSTLIPNTISAHRAACVALEGFARTPVSTLIPNSTVIGIGTIGGIYGLYKACTAKTWKESGGYALVSAAGFYVTYHEASRTFTDLVANAHSNCGSAWSGNRFPGWEKCSKAALGVFSYLSGKLQYTSRFSCPELIG